MYISLTQLRSHNHKIINTELFFQDVHFYFRQASHDAFVAHAKTIS